MKNLLLLFILFLGISQNVKAQAPMSPAVVAFNNKVDELTTKYKMDGFQTFKAGNLPMERNTETPIFIDMIEGRWYQFCVVGDPEAKKFEMKLGLAGVGDFITDKFKPTNTDEFWTTFSFICPRSGRYLLTFYQRGSKKDMMAYVSVLQRPNKTANGTLTYAFK
ncbi:MAG: hypothetical protein R2831_11075 [Chitinophagaceae bacterium]